MPSPTRRPIRSLARIIGAGACLVLLAAAALPAFDVDAAPPAATPLATPLPASHAPTTVLLDGVPVFEIASPLGGFTPAQRARAVTERMEAVARRPGPIPAARLVEKPYGTEVVLGETVVVTVTDVDAGGAHRVVLAGLWAKAIEAALDEGRERYSFRSIAIGGAKTLGSGLLLFLLALWISRLLRQVEERIHEGKGFLRAVPVKAGSVVLAREDQIKGLLLVGVRLARIVATVAAFFVWVSVAFAALPWTQPLARHAWGWISAPLTGFANAAISSLPDIFALVVIVVVARYVIRFVRFFFREIGEGRATIAGFEQDWAEPTAKIASFLVVAFAAVMAFPYLPGSGSEAFKSISLFLGLLLSLASSGAVSNLVAGTILTYTGAFKLGDRVKIGEQTGDIVEKSLLVTRIRTRRNVEISVPNATVLSGAIINYSAMARRGGVILSATVTIGYDVPWVTVHELLVTAALRTVDVLKEPRPFVLQTSLNDFNVSYEINAYITDSRKWDDILSRLHSAIQDSFNEAGVEIMSPAFTALRDGNTVAIPDAYKPKGYEAPGFRFK